MRISEDRSSTFKSHAIQVRSSMATNESKPSESKEIRPRSIVAGSIEINCANLLLTLLAMKSTMESWSPFYSDLCKRLRRGCRQQLAILWAGENVAVHGRSNGTVLCHRLCQSCRIDAYREVGIRNPFDV